MKRWLEANWPAPEWIHAGTTTRLGGVSKEPYAALNLANHVADSAKDVSSNRQRLSSLLELPSEPYWLNQTHTNVVTEANPFFQLPNCDGSYSFESGMVVAILTADCLPLLLCDSNRRLVAAIHVGWRGFCKGIIENALKTFPSPSNTMAWLGPCISKTQYEIDPPVRDACLTMHNEFAEFFIPNRDKHWLMDLKGMVRKSLCQHGIEAVYDSECCTYSDSEHWYSYRRDGVTGRMASLIWMDY